MADVEKENGTGLGQAGTGTGNGGGGSFSSIDRPITSAARVLIANSQSAAVGKQIIVPFVKESTFNARFGPITQLEVLLAEVDIYNDALTDNDDDDNNGDDDTSFSTKLYNPFNSTDIAQVDKQTITSGLFSNGSATLTGLFTASLQGSTTASYVEVFNANPSSDTTAQVQFALGYAHVGGSGSIGNTTKTTAGNRESAALYRQFRNVILAPNEKRFKFTSAPDTLATGSEDFYFLAFNRAQMREKVDPGNWEIRLNSATHGAVRLIDDSGATTNPDVNVSGRVFNIVSGSLSTGTAVIKTTAAAETDNGAPGLFYPDLGILIFNPEWLKVGVGAQLTPPRSANTFDDQANKFFLTFATGSGGRTPYVQARREEQISSVSYFARARNDQFNFSSNPTYSTGSSVTNANGDVTTTSGLFKVPSFKGDPRAYITQVGLYDGENGELVAVAKLSQPILKSFSREAVVKVKLDY